MKTDTLEEAKDLHIGRRGTKERDEYERKETETRCAFLMGEAIKKTRLSKNLTQEQLGEMMGVKRSQVSKIEKGRNLTFSTISRVFKAMDVAIFLDVAGVGKVAL